MKSKKKAVLLSILLILCLLLVSCNKNDKINKQTKNGDTNGEASAGFDLTPDSKEIKLMVYTGPESNEVDEFIRLYPDYTVDNSLFIVNPFIQTDYSINIQRLGAAIASNTPPDLFTTPAHPVEVYYTNMFIPLDEYLANDPVLNYNTMEPNVIKSGTFNGKVYFIPTAYDVQMLVWNKDLFEERGLDPEKPPATWSEFNEYNEKLLSYDSNGKISTIGAAPLGWEVLHIMKTGKQYTDPMGLTVNLNTAAFNEVIEFVISVSKPYGGMHKLPGDNSIGFFTGNVGMGQMVTNGLQLLPVWVGGRFDFGIGMLPKPDDAEEDYVPYSCGNILAIPRSANNPKGGWMYLKYLMTDNAYTRAVDLYNGTPICSTVPFIIHAPTREKLYEEFDGIFTEVSWNLIRTRDELISKANIPTYQIAEQTKFKLYLEKEWPKVLNNEIPPKEFLDNAQKYAEALIRDFKKTKEGENWKFNEDGTVVPPPQEK